MCGITAVFRDQPAAELADQLDRLIASVRHRGPDGSGTLLGRGRQQVERPQSADWGLGHVRLAIIDLSAAGLQPLSLADGQLWITYNGEVYNYRELADQLRSCGHTFHSQTDTEVVLAAYRQWGPACVEHFIGMFALVIVDLQNGQAFAARDRLGIKPLYLWSGPQQAVFVSELKQLLSAEGFRPRAEPQQVVDYLAEGLLGHEPQLTFFRGVHALPAGHRLQWPLGQRPSLADAEPYWQPSRQTQARTWDEAVEQTGELFRQAVRLRLRSDVPVGTCLSGGVDSSSIVGVAYHDCGAQMKTFSVCNNHPRLNEQPFIDAVNRDCHAEPVKLFLSPETLLDELDDFLYQQDEPVFSLSQYAEYCVMRAARQNGVPVLLNGQGGDETLCGYRKFAFFYLRQLLSQRRVAPAVAHLGNLLVRGDAQLFQLWQGIRYGPAWLRRRYDPMDHLLTAAWQPLRRAAWRERMQGVRSLHEHQWADLRHWSLPVLLRYQDRNSMAHSVEGRVPMVDHRFVEHALTLPEAFFFRGGKTKRVLVDALGRSLTEAVRRRRTKLGFDTPQALWLRGELGKQLEARVRSSPRLAEILDVQAAATAFAEYRRQATRVPHFALFRIACLAIWLERFEVDPR